MSSNKNTWLFLALGIGAILISANSNSSNADKTVTLEDKLSRKILLNGLTGFREFSLAGFNLMSLSIPMYNISFYSASQAAQIKSRLTQIKNMYSEEIATASRLCNVPDYIIVALIFNESAGNAQARSSAGAIGLMQLKPQSANDTIFTENKKGRLTQNEKDYLQVQLDDRLDAIFKMKYLSQPLPVNNNTGNVVTKDDLYNPLFNILCGTILIGLLIDQEKDVNGVLHIDRAFLRYNKGYFYKPKGTTFADTLTSQKPGTESYNYLLKMCGKNGLLELMA